MIFWKIYDFWKIYCKGAWAIGLKNILHSWVVQIEFILVMSINISNSSV